MNQTPQEQPPRKKISADEFIKIWCGDYKGVEGYEQHYAEDSILLIVKFDNYKVEGLISIKGYKNLPHLQLNNSDISEIEVIESTIKALELINSSTSLLRAENSTVSYTYIKDSSIGTFEVTNSTISDYELINSLTNKIVIDNGSTLGGFKINNSLGECNIYINNSSSAGNIGIYSSSVGDFYIYNNSCIGNLRLRNSVTARYRVSTSITGNISIKDSTIIDGFSINKSTIGNCEIEGKSSVGYIDINNNSVTKSFYVNDSSTKNITIYKSTSGDFRIVDQSIIGNCKIDNNSKTGFFNLIRSTAGNFDIENNSTVGHFWVCDNSTTGYFNINKSSQTSYYWICENSTTGYFYVSDNSITGDFDIEDSVIDSFDIYKSLVSKLSLRKSTVEHVEIVDSRLHELSFLYLNEESKSLLIEGSCIDKLTIKVDKSYNVNIKEFKENNSTKQSEVHAIYFDSMVFPDRAYFHVSQTYVNKISFTSFLNKGTIVLNGIKAFKKITQFVKDEEGKLITHEYGRYSYNQISADPSVLEIVESDLGNTQFIGCDLASFKNVKFKNSKMLEVFLADTLLPLAKNINKNVPDNNEQRKLALAQFKKIYENQGDTVRALEMRAQEMEIYRQLLRENKEIKNRNVERFNLFLNRWSNYYGTNWLLATVMTLSIVWFFFSAYCWAIGYRFGNDWNKFWLLFSHSFEFLNPIRRHPTFIEEDKVTPLARIIDYVGRIFISYMVYQTIQAFRKFGKK